jgi:hypothetical protein
MIEIEWQALLPSILVYAVSSVGLLLALGNVRSLDQINDNQSLVSFKSEEEESFSSSSESDSESSNLEREELFKRRNSQVSAKNEFRFFKDLNVFFKLDNRYILYLVSLLTIIMTIICFYKSKMIFVVAFLIGFIEFYSGFWFARTLFIKTSLSMDLSSDDKHIRWKNWNAFIKFVFSCLMFAFSGTIISVYTLFLIYNYLKPSSISPKAEYSFQKDGIIDPDKNMFVLLMICYYCGKNLLHIFNNMWESFNMNKQILKLLSKQYNRTKMLAFYSQGFYFNVINRIYKQGILISELLVVLTICVFQFTELIAQFFTYFYTVLLVILIIFYLVANYGFNFKDAKEAISMITVLKLGFTYFFVIAFLFFFYRFFIVNKIQIEEGETRKFEATFSYAYLLMIVIFLLQKISQYVFENNEFAKLKRMNTSEFKFEYFLNFQMILKLATIIIIAYIIFLILGFIGIVFMIFYLTIQKAFYRLKKFVIVFDIYIRIVLWVCQVVPIHNFTFNKLLELTDKGYIQNFYMLLFTIPLFTNINDLRRRASPSEESTVYSFEAYMFISFITMLFSIISLAIYTRLIYQKYMDTIERRSLKSIFQKNYLMLIIMHKQYFLLAMTAATFFFLYLFWKYCSYYVVLSLMVGFALHSMQLIYTNKIRVKKFFNVKLSTAQDESFIMKINHELAVSPTYLKSICELSFASIIVEINKIILLSYFFFHNIAT